MKQRGQRRREGTRNGRDFASEVEKLQRAEELFFPLAIAFGKYRDYLGHAVENPAKMNTHLLEFFIRKYTEPDDVVLDCMAGTSARGEAIEEVKKRLLRVRAKWTKQTQ